MEFGQLVRQHGAGKAAQGLTCWTQFVALLCCHLGHADALRGICHGLACCVGQLVHVGTRRAPKRSSLSCAHAHRPVAFREALYWYLAERLRRREGPGQRKTACRFGNKLRSLGSTAISLCLSLFPWVRFLHLSPGSIVTMDRGRASPQAQRHALDATGRSTDPQPAGTRPVAAL